MKSPFSQWPSGDSQQEVLRTTPHEWIPTRQRDQPATTVLLVAARAVNILS
jgi:hypothetical protein